MNYELAKELKEAGFPQDLNNGYYLTDLGITPYSPTQLIDPSKAAYIPTLEELIEACGDEFALLEFGTRQAGWCAQSSIANDHVGFGKTPTEAVARLWLALNKK